MFLKLDIIQLGKFSKVVLVFLLIILYLVGQGSITMFVNYLYCLNRILSRLICQWDLHWRDWWRCLKTCAPRSFRVARTPMDESRIFYCYVYPEQELFFKRLNILVKNGNQTKLKTFYMKLIFWYTNPS